MSKSDLSTYRNDGYAPGNTLKRVLWYFTSLIFFRSAFPWPSAWKRFLLRLFGARIASGVVIKPSVQIKYPWFLDVGEHTWIGEHVWIDNLVQVSVGGHVCLSQGALLLTGNHNYSLSSFNLITQRVSLENGVWIGAKATVCPGVICETHSVLTVGSVARSRLGAYGIYSGNPAERIRTRKIT